MTWRVTGLLAATSWELAFLALSGSYYGRSLNSGSCSGAVSIMVYSLIQSFEVVHIVAHC